MSAGVDALRLAFPDDGVSALAVLLNDEAPATVDGILAALPIKGVAGHAIYSGSEIALFIPPDIRISEENATHRVLPRDLAYYRFDGGVHYGFPDDVSELCWFYDRDAVPSMPDGPVAVNIFGRFTEGWEDFARVCRAMRTEGAKRVIVDRA